MKKLTDLGVLTGMLGAALALTAFVGCKADPKHTTTTMMGGTGGTAAGGAGGAAAGGAGGTAGSAGGSSGSDAAAPRDGGGDGVAATGDGAAATGDGGAKLASSTGMWTEFPIMPNPATGIKGTIDAFDAGGTKTQFKLSVSGLMPNTDYGIHLHKLACSDMSGGAHYQNAPAPDGGSAANAMNEVWLDIKTDAMGNGMSMTTVDWRPRVGEAKSIVVHALKTMPDGTAGLRAACISMLF